MGTGKELKEQHLILGVKMKHTGANTNPILFFS